MLKKVMKLMSDLSAYAQTVWLGPFPNYGADPVRAVFDLSMRTMAKNQQERLFVLDNHVLEVSKRRNFFSTPGSLIFTQCLKVRFFRRLHHVQGRRSFQFLR
ncbi:hypothetical protein QW131_09120 [Roseibium salinum]|nr:hypothetical protein [Roseibium salinum]